MAAIPTILKGDDSGAISITMASGRTYTGATLVVAYQGVTRSFTNLTPGQTITFAFTHEETSGFELKTSPLLMRLIGQYGAEETVENAEARIRVTDCLAEVNAGGSFVVRPGEAGSDPTKVPITDVGDMAARYSLADLQAKVNQIVRVLAQRSLLSLLLSACCLSLFGGVSVHTARLDSLYNDAQVVTNVTATSDIPQDYTTTNAVCNLITNNVAPWAMAGKSEPQGMTTNVVQSIIQKNVETNMLCTVAAASAMTNALPNWTKSANKPTYTASEVRALPAEETASDYYKVSPGVHVNWLDISCNFSIGHQYQMYWDGQKGVLGGSGSVWYYGGTDESHEIAVKGDIPDAYTKDEADAAFATKEEQAATQAIVQTWEGFLDGSNVVFSITNYISGTYSLNDGKFKVLELTNGVYREVYDSRSEIVLHINNFKDNDFRTATNSVITSVDSKIADKADKAWGKYTSAGGEAPSNTVYMTAPNTVFAGGLEYERVAVGEGAVCVLTTKGAPTWTQGDEGTFKFQDDGGTNYFGFAKTDSYVIGCDTDGISVQNHIVTLRYDITMSGVPCIWYKEDIASNVAWEQLNTPDGQPIAGASHVVSWEQNPPAGQELCYINCPEAKGYFKATIEVAGEAKFMTNMPADLGGGIMCTNTATGVNGKIKPSFNGSSVIWTWSAL